MMNGCYNDCIHPQMYLDFGKFSLYFKATEFDLQDTYHTIKTFYILFEMFLHTIKLLSFIEIVFLLFSFLN